MVPLSRPAHGAYLSTCCSPCEPGDILFPAARQAGTEQSSALNLKGAQINTAK